MPHIIHTCPKPTALSHFKRLSEVENIIRSPLPTVSYAYDVEAYAQHGALARAESVGGSIYGLPDRPEGKPVPEPDRKGSRLTHPNMTDADVQFWQFVRITGLKGGAVLTRADVHGGKAGTGRMLTARGMGTHNVPINLSGLVPDMRLSVPSKDDGTDCTITGSEIRHLRRYRDGMKGARFAESMATEQRERDLAYWRAAFPWVPLKTRGGEQVEGKSYNRMDGIGERIYPDGTMLSEHRQAWLKLHEDGLPDHLAPQSDDARLREIERLKEEQADDMGYDKRHARRVRQENIATANRLTGRLSF